MYGIFFTWIIFLESMSTVRSKGTVFPVNSCPGNISEVGQASKRLNCSGIDQNKNTYHCLPLSDLSQLVELCYQTSYLIETGNCMVLQSGYLNNRPCLHFTEGCPNTTYQSKLMLNCKCFAQICKEEDPVCTNINKQNRCYLADPSCPSLHSDFDVTTVSPTINVSLLWTTSTRPGDSSGGKTWIVVPVLLAALVVIALCSWLIWKLKCRCKANEIQTEEIGMYSISSQYSEREALLQENENENQYEGGNRMNEVTNQYSEADALLTENGNEDQYEGGTTLIEDILRSWQEDNKYFVQTRASTFVEEKIKSQNLVTVVGNSGCGKSAIIQHIALKLKEEQGWNIKPVDEVKEIKEICSPGISPDNQTLFVLNDPIGKETLDDISYNSWKTYETTLQTCLKRVKLLVSCRRCVINDKKLEGILKKKSNIVEIDSNKLNLTDKEKREIFNKYCQHMDISEEKVREIIKTEAYFPLLCKVFSCELSSREEGVNLFKNPFLFIKQEIEHCKIYDKHKYCALLLIMAFNNNLNIRSIKKNEISLDKYKNILGMCELLDNMDVSVIGRTLNELDGSYIKRVGQFYKFLHDFIMEITTLVFGVDCPQETIRYADGGFLRRRMKIEDDTEEEDRDPFTVYLPEEYIGDLVDRFIIDMQTEHLVDVLLNPCLRKESVIKSLMEKVDSIGNFLVRIKCKIDKSEFSSSFKDFAVSRLQFFDSKDQISPLIGFIIFCHNDISSFLLKIIDQTTLIHYSVFSAVCANGNSNLLNFFSEEYKKLAIMEIWGIFLPIHVASVFHNFLIIEKLADFGADVNKLTTDDKWTPLLLATTNDEVHVTEAGMETNEGERRNMTIIVLINKGANINLCTNDGASPLYIACQNGHDSTVELLLKNGADLNLCIDNGVSPLYIACQQGHDSTTKLLLKNGANINTCTYDGVSPLHAACKTGYDSTVKLLLNNRADINLCNENGVSPLYIACQHGHVSTVHMLLNNGADINLCDKNGVSPLCVACQDGHDSTVLLLLKNGADVDSCTNGGASPLHVACQYGHDSTVQLLMNSSANINLCEKNKVSPLYIACQNRHDGTVHMLLNNGADINLCTKDGGSPLYIACEHGHDSLVQMLLNNGADNNLCTNDGVSPLYIACQLGHANTVQLLLNNGADINLCTNVGANLCTTDGVSPLFIACQHGHADMVQLLLNNGANINLGTSDGASPLFIACEHGHESMVQLLLNNGADINSCTNDGASPLHIACQKGPDNVVYLLLNNGANINLRTNDGASPLYFACQNEHYSTVQMLFDHGVDVNLCDKSGAIPLYLACEKGHDSIVQLLLKKGAVINSCTNDEVSPLYIACQNGHDSTVKLLLNNGADINSCTNDGASPLFIACENGDDSTVHMLLNNGANINLRTNDGASPLFIACASEHDSTVQLLLNNSADINLCTNDGVSPLFIACENGRDSTVHMLLNNGADINSCTNDGASPLFIACENGDYSTVHMLLNNDADINLCTNDGASPLLISCQNGHDSTVQLLLNNGANINLCTNDGISSLYIACENGHDSPVQLLLNSDADINLCTDDGISPLYIACQNGHDSTVKLLLKNGANSNSCTSDGASPLYIACQNGHDSTVQLLLNSGADKNLCYKNGVSPLHVACQNGLDSTVQLLLKNGADINIYTNDGASPLYIACQNGHDSTVQLLLSYVKETIGF